MSRVRVYLEVAIQGLGRYFEENKLVVLVLALLLAWWLAEKKPENTKGKTLLFYTLGMTLLLIFPVSAIFVMLYQTAFYDYEWAWSMVPVTAVIAYGATFLVERFAQKGKLFLGILGITAVLCLCGNQGTITLVEEETAAAQEDTRVILQEIHAFDRAKQRILWAPENIMEQVRRLDGKFLLIYGRDMWDTKAGAYDYEAYSEELTNAYIWLEVMEQQAELASIMADPMKSFRILCEEEDLNRTRENHLNTVLDAGANVVVLPNLVAEHIEESITKLAGERKLELQSAYTEKYTIYLLE